MLLPVTAVAAGAAKLHAPAGEAGLHAPDGVIVQAPPCQDVDLDGFVDCRTGCQPGQHTCGDCDDGDPLSHPGATETCDHRDEDCDGVPDEGFPSVVTNRLVTDPAGQFFDSFGSALTAPGDLSGDGWPDLAVGAKFWKNAANVQVGSVLVVSGVDGAPLCRMVDPQGQSSDNLSIAEPIGDLNGDGVTDLVTGGRKILVFSGADCSLIRQCTRTEIFNSPAAGAGDVNQDGVPDIVVGAPNFGLTLVLSGSNCALLFSSVGGGPGGAVAGIGDVTGDGRPDVAATGTNYLYVLSGAGGGLVWQLTDPARFAGALKGLPDISGDGVPDIIAGTDGNGTTMSSPGGVLLVSAGNGTILRRCVHPEASPYDFLGRSLAAVPDMTGEGRPEILAGAPGDDTALGADAGSVLLFSSADCSVLRRIEDPQGSANGEFGSSVAAVGDLTGDGQAELAASRAVNLDRPSRGAFRLFAIESVCDSDGLSPFQGDCDDTDASVLPQAAEICDARDNDCNAGVDDDGDGDGHGACADCDVINPLIHPGATETCNARDDDCDGATDEGPDGDGDGVAAPCDCKDDDLSIRPGAPDACDHVDQNCDGRKDEGSMTLSILVPGPDPSGNEINYWGPLASLGDLTADGTPDVAVGIPSATGPGGAGYGMVILYSGRDRSEICRATDPEGAPDDNFGNAVAPLGDVTGDGVADLAASAPYDDFGGLYSAGSVLIVSGGDCSVVRRCTDPPTLPSGRSLGSTVAAVGDLTGDGLTEVAAASPGASTAGAMSAGEVTLFDPTTCAVVRRLVDPDPQDNARLGESLAGLGDVNGDGSPDIAAGSLLDRRGGIDSGSVLVFSGADGSLIRRLRHPSPSSGDYFGYAVAALGDMTGDGVGDLAVSALRDSVGGLNFLGSVLFYSGRDGAFLRLCSDADTNGLGNALAPAGDVTGDGVPDVVVGASEDRFVDFPIWQSARGTVLVISGADCAVAGRMVDPAGLSSDRFGSWVLAPGDLGGDGAPEIVTVSRSRLWIVSGEADCDADGITPFDGDCDETDPARAAGRLEVCDGRDNDCDSAVDEDGDGDGFAVCADCDDARFSAHPGAPEVCDGRDDDCDGATDEGFDADGDALADCLDNCSLVSNAVQEDNDGDGIGNACDVESCDGFDNDGDGLVDEGFSAIPETCNHVDDNCDGQVDPGAARAWGVRKVVSPTGGGGDRFGQAIAGIGDVTGDHVPDIVVGADGRSTPDVPVSGGATILSGADQSVVCDLIDPTGETSDRLGTAAIGLGDVDGDGHPDVAVSARQDFSGFDGYRGSVSVFSGADCSFLRKCADPGPPAGLFGESLGQSLAAVGDVTGDGIPDLAAGVPGADTAAGTDAGVVVLFSGSDCSVIGRLVDPLGAPGANLGIALATAGDVSGDGVTDLLAGAQGGAGGAVVFSLADGSILRRLADPGTPSGSRLGSSVAVLPDLSSDGVPDLAVGAMLDDVVQKDGGSMLLFSGADGALLRKCSDPLGSPLAALGAGVAAYPDLDGDGSAEIATLAPFQHTPFGPGNGTLLVLSGQTCAVLVRHDLAAGPWIRANNLLDSNRALAVPGDLDGDHVSEIAVGAPGANVGYPGVGLALILGRTSDCDADGATPLAGDCDDASMARAPGRAELCDGMDNDCDALVDEDSDGDGFAACADCDNDRAATHPGAPESCNGLDDDCSGTADDGPDLDVDGVSAPCDCADRNSSVHPGAVEVCNHLDDNCNVLADENQPQVWKASIVTDPAGPSNGQFGRAVAGLGDVDGDAVPDVAVSNLYNYVIVVSGKTRAVRCRGTGRSAALAGIDDVSGDGVPDIVSGGGGSVSILSGANCSLIRTCSFTGATISLGTSVAVLGDVTGDGVPDLAAGAPGTQPGEVAVFSGSNCSLLYRISDPTLVGSPISFGTSVAGPGDLSGDGWPDLVVGAPYDSSLGIQFAGRLVVVSGPDGTIIRRLHDPAASPSDRLGSRVTGIGDLTGDGVQDLLAMVYADSPPRNDVGAVLVFSGAGGTILRRCSDPSAPAYEYFGEFLASTEDFTGDGLPDFAVYERGGSTPGAAGPGTVLLISSSDCAIVERLMDPAATSSSVMGYGALAAPGDLTGDGRGDLVAGADAYTSARGHVVLFSASSSCEATGGGDNCAAVENIVQADSDQDGVGNLCDLCPDASDPAQADADADGAGDACDCSPVTATERRPAEVNRVDVDSQGRILWTPTASAESYLVRRGALTQQGLGNYGACWTRVTGLRAGDVGVLDPVAPAVGTGVYYMVQGEDAVCGRGLLGFSTDEVLRTVSGPDPCP